jgi:hypothetical protein
MKYPYQTDFKDTVDLNFHVSRNANKPHPSFAFLLAPHVTPLEMFGVRDRYSVAKSRSSFAEFRI